MFAWGAQNILARGFYAARDTLTPAITGTALTFLNLPLYWWLGHHYQYLGLAMASSAGIIVYTLLLFGLLNRRTKNPESAEMVWFFLKITAASVIAAGVCLQADPSAASTHRLANHSARAGSFGDRELGGICRYRSARQALPRARTGLLSGQVSSLSGFCGAACCEQQNRT